jgi:hypothetical protein
LAKWAQFVEEDGLWPVCKFAEGDLLQGTSGMFYFNTYEVFRKLGTTKEDAVKYFIGEANWNNAPVVDPYSLMAAKTS